MKINRYMIMALAGFGMLTACSDDDVKDPGAPRMEYYGLPAQVCFGDSLPFTVNASDASVPLSTVKGELFINGELVSSRTVRTKVSGETYTGRVFVPYLPYAEGTAATLRITLQNINFTTTQTEEDFVIEYPDFPFVTLKGADGNMYELSRVDKGKYAATGSYPSDILGVIVTPAYGENGNELQFGFKGESIEQGGSTGIKFMNLIPGDFELRFNTHTYEYGPIGELKFNDEDFVLTGTDYIGQFYLTKGQEINPVGFPSFDDWTINPDYFNVRADGKLEFTAGDGYYRVVPDLYNKCFNVMPVDEYGEEMSLQSDGTGTLWLMGTGVGFPDYAGNQIGWVPANMVPFAPMGDKKFRLTFLTGKTLNSAKFTLRIFEGRGWTTTLKPDILTLQTPLLKMNVPGKEAHNIYLNDGVVLDENSFYEMIVDLSAGNDAGVLTFEKKQ